MKRFWYACRRTVGRMLAALEVHRVTFRENDGQTQVVKRRTRIGNLLLPAGNLFLRLTRADSCLLPERKWHRWEQVMTDANIESRNVITCRQPGVTLDKILQSSSLSIFEKLKAVKFARAAMRALHSRTTELNGETWPLSHGDATVENVCVDLVAESAHWFDFDMRHREHLSAMHRQADDVRALLFSSAVYLPVCCYPDLAKTCIAKVSDVSSFETRLDQWKRSTVFQLAQAPLPYENNDRLMEALQAAIRN